MRKLQGAEASQAQQYYQAVAETAAQALCRRAKCGTVIVQHDAIIGRGYNAPPLDDLKNATCDCEYPEPKSKKKADKTCCMHAEWRAIINALQMGNDLQGSTLYFGRVDSNGNLIPSGQPYCTICSRLALDTGIAEFVLWHDDGITAYPTQEYNDLSYKFHQ